MILDTSKILLLFNLAIGHPLLYHEKSGANMLPDGSVYSRHMGFLVHEWAV